MFIFSQTVCCNFRDLEECLEMGMDWSLREGNTEANNNMSVLGNPTPVCE